MSWIGGGIVIDDVSEKSLSYAKAMIRSRVLDEGNCGEFSNLGNSIYPIIDFSKLYCGRKLFGKEQE